jgi:hypothetical protein
VTLRVGMIVTALIGVAGILVVEVFAVGNSTEGDTLSEIVADLSDVTSAAPFALGALLGHFVSRRKVAMRPWLRIVSGLSLVPAAVLLHFVDLSPLIAAPTGMVAGWLLWPLKKKD